MMQVDVTINGQYCSRITARNLGPVEGETDLDCGMHRYEATLTTYDPYGVYHGARRTTRLEHHRGNGALALVRAIIDAIPYDETTVDRDMRPFAVLAERHEDVYEVAARRIESDRGGEEQT